LQEQGTPVLSQVTPGHSSGWFASWTFLLLLCRDETSPREGQFGGWPSNEEDKPPTGEIAMRVSWIKGLWVPERTKLVPDARFWVALIEFLNFVHWASNSPEASVPDECVLDQVCESIQVLEAWIYFALNEGYLDDAPDQLIAH
jgi:hypothetical protein